MRQLANPKHHPYVTMQQYICQNGGSGIIYVGIDDRKRYTCTLTIRKYNVISRGRRISLMSAQALEARQDEQVDLTISVRISNTKFGKIYKHCDNRQLYVYEIRTHILSDGHESPDVLFSRRKPGPLRQVRDNPPGGP